MESAYYSVTSAYARNTIAPLQQMAPSRKGSVEANAVKDESRPSHHNVDIEGWLIAKMEKDAQLSGREL